MPTANMPITRPPTYISPHRWLGGLSGRWDDGLASHFCWLAVRLDGGRCGMWVEVLSIAGAPSAAPHEARAPAPAPGLDQWSQEAPSPRSPNQRTGGLD